MTTATHYPHLTIRSDGSAYIGQTRYTVLHLATEHYHYGWSAEELLRQHPDLRPEEVYAALTFFYDNFDRLVSEITPVKSPPPFSNLSRDELLSRKQKSNH